MTILDEIKKDVNCLRKLTSPTPPRRIQLDGVFYHKEALTQQLMAHKEKLQAELQFLEAMIAEKIIPAEYKSIITGKTFYPTDIEKAHIQKTQNPRTLPYYYFCHKNSRKNTSHPQKLSSIAIINQEGQRVSRFFLEHIKPAPYKTRSAKCQYAEGSFAPVKKGCHDANGLNPFHAVKIYDIKKNIENKLFDDTEEARRTTMRAAYCYRQLGQDAFSFYRPNKAYLVTKWLKGKDLDEVAEEDMMELSIPSRIKLAISLLIQIQKLHQRGLIHRDIKPNNVMIDLINEKISLIDLDSVTPINLTKPLIFTSEYLPDEAPFLEEDVEGFGKNFCVATDVYAAGITLAALFPEIFSVPETEEINGKMVDISRYKLVPADDYAKHPELRNILEDMTDYKDTATLDLYIHAFKNVLSSKYQMHFKQSRETGPIPTPSETEEAFKEIEKIAALSLKK